MSQRKRSRRAPRPAPAPARREPPSFPPSPVVLVEEALHLTGYRSKVSLWSLEKKGLFPTRRRLGPNRVGWLRAELEAWLASRPRGIGAEVVQVDKDGRSASKI